MTMNFNNPNFKKTPQIFVDQDECNIYLPVEMVAQIGEFGDYMYIIDEKGERKQVPSYEKLRKHMPLELEFLLRTMGYSKVIIDQYGLPYELLPVIYSFFKCNRAFHDVVIRSGGCIYAWLVNLLMTELFGTEEEIAKLFEKEQRVMESYNQRVREVVKHPNYIKNHDRG